LEQEAAVLAVGGIGPSAAFASRTSRQGPAEPCAASPIESRALITIEAPAPSDRTATATRRPLAAFLAHLIATQSQAPQTRARRRAEPEDVVGLYLAAAKPRRATRTKLDREA
jgi:hypothetical protein